MFNRFIKKGFLVWVGVALWLLWPAQPVLSKSSAKSLPTVQGEIIRDYARITFEWPQTVYFNASTRGKILSITFDRKADPDVGSLLKQLSPYIAKIERKSDGKTLELTLDKPYKIRTFVSDNVNGIDLLQIDPKARHASPVKVAAPQPAPQKKPVVVAQPKPMDVQASKLAQLSPAAGEEPSVPPEQKTNAPAVVMPSVISQPAVINDSDALPPDLAQQILDDPSRPLKVIVSASEDSATLRFPFKERTAMAIFTRARYLWMVTGSALSLDVSDFNDLPRTVIGKAELVPVSKGTALRIPIDDGVYIQVAKEENNFEWAVLLTPKKKPLNTPLKITINTEPPAPPHVFIPTLEMAESATLQDPQIGDVLIVTPLFNPGEGVILKRDFIEFSVLASAQGVVISKISDDASVVQLRNGLRIALPGGAILSPSLPKLEEESAASASISVATLFPYDYWKVDAIASLRPQIQGLMQRIASSSTVLEANDARLRLATLYLSEAMAPETVGVLDNINRTNPSFYRSAKLSSLRGAANFLMYRFVDAARDFSSSELNNNKEIDYWRAMLADLLGNPNQSYDYLAMNQDYISKYPPVLRQRLAIVAADRSIANKQHNTALKIFDTLKQDNLLDSVDKYINFLLASISAETGQEVEALEKWDKLAVNLDHPFVQSRAEFSRIVWGMNHNHFANKDEVIDRLEKLRLSWHGDSLELNVLTILGDLYLEKKDYVNAMRIWKGGITSFPNTATAIDMTRKMQEAFKTMFNEGLADTLPAIDALALYYEYRNFAPSGASGDDMIEKLADKLVSIDLLDQAAALLDHQMRFQTEKEQRSRIGTKLATVYLLNRQPQKALEALQDSAYGENSLIVRLLRNRLTAESMLELDKPDKALATLGEDSSADADYIRVRVYWHQKDWPKLIAGIESILKTRHDIDAPVTLDESEYLLKLSLAYIFQDDKAQLQYLRDYFGPLMANSPNKPVFDFITGDQVELSTTNFDEIIQNLSNTRSFIENYRARIQTAGLNTMMPESGDSLAKQ